MNDQQQVMLITGTRKGIGKYLTDYYLEKGYFVYGCSRTYAEFPNENYKHFSLDVADESNAFLQNQPE